VIIMFPVMVAFAVMPFAASARGGLVPNLNVGLIYLVAITSLVGIGMLTAGWGSGNKYALLSGMRIVATMVSYEFPVVLSLIGVAMMAGSLSLNDIVGMQQDRMWFILLQPLGFLIFFIGMLAEASRSPFDYAEGESETSCGVHIEYSGLRFGLFQLTEWTEGILMSCLVTTLFLGGYSFLGPVWTYPDGPLGVFIGLVVFLLKTSMVYLVLGWIKCTLPGRLRIDQWMGFAWKGLLPLAVLNLFIVAVEIVGFGRGDELPLWVILINIFACVVLILLWSRLWKTGGGRVNVRAVR
jgi:NADH-quinone oxidoreductase subunit H